MPGGRTGPSGEWLGRHRGAVRARPPSRACRSRSAQLRGRPALSSPAGPVRPPGGPLRPRGGLSRREAPRAAPSPARHGGVHPLSIVQGRSAEMMRQGVCRTWQSPLCPSRGHPVDRSGRGDGVEVGVFDRALGERERLASRCCPASSHDSGTHRPRHFRASRLRDLNGCTPQLASRQRTRARGFPPKKAIRGATASASGGRTGPAGEIKRRPASACARLAVQTREHPRAGTAPLCRPSHSPEGPVRPPGTQPPAPEPPAPERGHP